MITLEQQEKVNNWISDCPPSFDDGAFTDMAIKCNIFGLSGNDCDFARSIQEYIDKLVDDGILNKSSGWCGTVYCRAEK